MSKIKLNKGNFCQYKIGKTHLLSIKFSLKQQRFNHQHLYSLIKLTIRIRFSNREKEK